MRDISVKCGFIKNKFIFSVNHDDITGLMHLAFWLAQQVSAYILVEKMFTWCICETIISTFNQNHIDEIISSAASISGQGTICDFVSQGYLFSAGFRLRENKSTWMTFWKGVICFSRTKAGGLSIALELIKGEWMMHGTTEFSVCTPHLLWQFWALQLLLQWANNEGSEEKH